MAALDITNQPTVTTRALWAAPAPMLRSADHVSMRLTPRPQELDWDEYPGIDTIVPAEGARMTPLYAALGNWLETHPHAETRELCGEVLRLIHVHFGQYNPAVAAALDQGDAAFARSKNLRDAVQAKSQGTNESVMSAAEIVARGRGLGAWIDFADGASLNPSRLQSYSEEQRKELSRRYAELSALLHSYKEGQPEYGATLQRFDAFDGEVARHELRGYLKRPEASDADVRKAAQALLDEREALRAEAEILDRQAHTNSIIVSREAKRPPRTSLESLPSGTLICGDFAALAAGILRNLKIPNVLAGGGEHAFVILPFEKAVFETTSPDLERGGWQPIRQATGAETKARTLAEMPNSFVTEREHRYTVEFAEGFPQQTELNRSAESQKRFLETQAAVHRQTRLLVWELTHSAVERFPF